jgi:hypothetical protein
MLFFNLYKLERNCKEFAYTCHREYVFHIVTASSVVSQVMEFILTGFTVGRTKRYFYVGHPVVMEIHRAIKAVNHN